MLRKLLTSLLIVGVAWLTHGCSDSDEAGSSRLRSLTLSSGTLVPSFDTNTSQYKAYVDEDINSLEVVANPDHANATVTIEDDDSNVGPTSSVIPLTAEERIITITVIAQDGINRRDYFVTVLRGEAPVDNNDDNSGDNTGNNNDGTTGDSGDDTTPSGVSHTWNQAQRLKASNIAAEAAYGQSIQTNNGLLIIGAPKENDKKGAVYVYENVGGNWLLKQKIQPGSLNADSRFGQSLAMNDGILAIGAPYEQSSLYRQGHVYTYRLQGTQFSFIARLTSTAPLAHEQFGASVTLDNTTLAVGSIRSTENGFQGGKVSVYSLSGNTWSLQGKLGGNNFGSHDIFARSISLSGNTLAVGSFDPDQQCQQPGNDNGSVYVYQRTGTTWNQQQILTAEDGDDGDRFGYAVSLDGDELAIGAQCEDGAGNSNTQQGAVYVYGRNNGTWTLTQKLSASNGTAHSLFGDKAILSGNRLFVGASFDSSAGVNAAGAAYVYEKNVSNQWTQTQILRASNLGADDRFGWSLGYGDNQLVIGAPNEDSHSVAAEGSNSVMDSGSIYVFQ